MATKALKSIFSTISFKADGYGDIAPQRYENVIDVQYAEHGVIITFEPNTNPTHKEYDVVFIPYANIHELRTVTLAPLEG